MACPACNKAHSGNDIAIYAKLPCSLCKGTGKRNVNGKIINCAHCKGSGTCSITP